MRFSRHAEGLLFIHFDAMCIQIPLSSSTSFLQPVCSHWLESNIICARRWGWLYVSLKETGKLYHAAQKIV